MKKTHLLQVATCLAFIGCTKNNLDTANAYSTPENTVSTFAVETILKNNPENIKMGVAVKDDLYRNTAGYSNLAIKHFDRVTSEADMKLKAILGKTLSQYNNTFPDLATQCVFNDNFIYNVRDKGMHVHGHVLCWGDDTKLPSWVLQLESSLKASNPTGYKTLFRNFLEGYIKKVVTHYSSIKYANGDRVVESWDVLNEVFNATDGGERSSVWSRTLGADYKKLSFIWAKEAAIAAGDNNLKLFYNDFGHEYSKSKCTSIYNLAMSLQTSTVSGKKVIDGVSMQMHLKDNTTDLRFTDEDPNYADDYSVERGIQKMKTTGLEVFISELDVEKNLSSDATQKNIYYVTALLYRQNVPTSQRHGISVWALTDNTSWLASVNPCLFEDNYSVKSTFYSFYGGLTN